MFNVRSETLRVVKMEKWEYPNVYFPSTKEDKEVMVKVIENYLEKK